MNVCLGHAKYSWIKQSIITALAYSFDFQFLHAFWEETGTFLIQSICENKCTAPLYFMFSMAVHVEKHYDAKLWGNILS